MLELPKRLNDHPHPNRELLLQLDGTDRSLGAGGFVSVPRGVPHAYLVTSEVARSLVLITPGDRAMEAFFRDAGEAAPERTLPAERPLDIERIAQAAERTGAVRSWGLHRSADPATDCWTNIVGSRRTLEK